MTPLPAPPYAGPAAAGDVRLGLAVGSMRHHTTDEGWQLFQGLEAAGYTLCGHGLTEGETDVARLVDRLRPHTVVTQDKREWTGRTAGRGFDERERFAGVGSLRDRPEVFRVTVLKDAHADQEFHRAAADEAGVHGWVVYYHPDVVRQLAPYVRREHLLRTYHTVDPAAVPAYTPDGRRGCLLSGAVSGAYPLRRRLVEARRRLPATEHLPHPGYHRRGCATPGYLRQLAQYRVAVCTASRYGYALRKIMEATAAGCAVITDLPEWEVLPGIDGNLHRVTPEAEVYEVAGLIDRLVRDYDPAAQRRHARAAAETYDYRVQGRLLAANIETLRRTYPC